MVPVREKQSQRIGVKMEGSRWRPGIAGTNIECFGQYVDAETSVSSPAPFNLLAVP